MSGVDPRVRRALDGLAGEVAPTHGLFSQVERRITQRRRRRASVASLTALAVVAGVLAAVSVSHHDDRSPIQIEPAETTTPAVSTEMPRRILASTSNNGVVVLDSSTGKILQSLTEPSDDAWGAPEIVVAPNGERWYYTSPRGVGDTACDVARRVGSIGFDGSPGGVDAEGSGIVVSLDGRYLAYTSAPDLPSCAAEEVHILDLGTGEERLFVPDEYVDGRYVSPETFSPDSKQLLVRTQAWMGTGSDTGSGTVLDAATGKVLAQDHAGVFPEGVGDGDALRALPGGGFILADNRGDGPGNVARISAGEGGERNALFTTPARLSLLSTDPSGRHILVGYSIRSGVILQRWSEGDPQPTLLRLHNVLDAEWIPDSVTIGTPTSTTTGISTSTTTGVQGATTVRGWEMLPEAPIAGRSYAAAVWTGSEMVVWGGEGKGYEPLGDGAAYDPAARTWRAIAPAPIDARAAPTAVWTGTEMIVWGGATLSGRDIRPGETVFAADGAAYDPVADSWRRIGEAPITTMWKTWAVWTGGEMFVGGLDPTTSKFMLAAYDPWDETWRVVTPPEEGDLEAIWTGSELLVWSNPPAGAPDETLHGYVYVSATDSWRRLADVPHAVEGANDRLRFEPVAWTGEVVIGKRAYSTQVYDPATDTYREVAGGWGEGSSARVWTGREILDWGGTDLEADTYQADGDAFDLATDTVTALPPSPLDGRQSPAAVWTGTEMLVWGGLAYPAEPPPPGGSYLCFADGASYRPPEVTPPPTVAGGEPATIIALTSDGIVERSSVDGSVLRTIVSGRPGGTTIRVEVDRARSRVFFGESLECGSAIWQVPLGGGRPEPVSWGSGLSVSPDGRWLAFPRVEDGCAAGALVLHEIEGGGERIWRDIPGEVWGTEWAPDGLRLAVGSASDAAQQSGEIRVLATQNRYATFATSPVLTGGYLKDSVIVDGRWVLAVVRRCDHDADMECKDEVVTVDGDTGQQIESFGSWQWVDNVDLDATGRNALVLASEETEPGHSQVVMFAVEPGGRGRRIAPAADADW